MNYYIQGNKEKADQIKAAFGKYVSTQEMAEYDFSQEEYLFYTGQEERGTFVYAAWSDSVIAEIIKTHPDYKELELPIEFKDGDINVYFLEGTIEGKSGWHFFVGCSKEISTEKYVKFCNYLQKALDVLNEKED